MTGKVAKDTHSQRRIARAKNILILSNSAITTRSLPGLWLSILMVILSIRSIEAHNDSFMIILSKNLNRFYSFQLL
jgi:hypothetical protein